MCFTGNECNSKLRILRAASTHYAVLRSFLHAVYDAIRNHKRVAHLDAALHSGDSTYLMRACQIDSYESLLAYVALSRLKSLAGLHSVAFTPQAKCSIEISRDIYIYIGVCLSYVKLTAAELLGPNTRMLKSSFGRLKMTCDTRVIQFDYTLEQL